MRGGVTSALLLPIMMLLAASCFRSVPETFPYDAAAVDLRGAPATLAPLRGFPMVVVAYVASMPDCRERIRRFVLLSESFRASEIRFVAVDIGFGQGDRFPDVLPEDRGNVLFLNDRSRELGKALRIDVTPTTFLVLPGGRIRDRLEGFHDWDSPDFRRRLAGFGGGH